MILHPRDGQPGGPLTSVYTVTVILWYCSALVKNITLSVPEDVYRQARIRAAERDTSISALVAEYLRSLSGRETKFSRLEAKQREVRDGIDRFRAGDRLDRDALHARAVR